jgi:DNA-directed RNA polymerase specialized sigma subunit
MNRPAWEILVGNPKKLDYLASIQDEKQQQQHPLQEIIEDIIDSVLTEHEREVFHLRFGELLSFREMAERMGYDSHMTFQYQVEKIMKKVEKGLEEWILRSQQPSES